MRILIDGETLCSADGGVGAGVEHYSWELVRALLRTPSAHTYLLALPERLSADRLALLLDGAVNPVECLKPVLPRVPLLSRHVLAPLRWWLSRADVVVSPFGQVPLGWYGKSVLTIHDVAIFEHPEWFAGTGSQTLAIKWVVPRSFARADRLVAVSETTADHLLRLYPAAAPKTAVVYEGVSVPESIDHRRPARFPYDRDFVLSLGTIEPRKNLPFALRSFDQFLHQHPECAQSVRFVLAGKMGWGTQEVERLAAQINRTWSSVEPKGVVHFLGAVSEEEKWQLLTHAGALAFSSFEEGFGLPVLEAMAVGTPVIASPAPAVLEVGGDALMVVSSEDACALALAQCLLLPEGVEFLREEGVRRARQFTWEHAANEFMGIIETL